ncbi:MAG: peptidylprolyl isomerase [Spirochaetota bacterium]
MRYRVMMTLVLLLATSLVFAGGGREQNDEQDDQQTEQSSGADEQIEDSGDSEVDSRPGTVIGGSDPSRNIATVNGVSILREDYESAVEQTRMRFAQQGQQVSEAEMEAFRTEILDQLIAEELLYQEALRQDIEAPSDAIEAQYQQMRSQFPTDEQWQQALQTNNTTEEELRVQVERNALIQQLIEQAVGETTPVTDEEVQAFYDENPQFFAQDEQVAARHILISTEELEGDEAIEEARGRAEAVRQELLEGADFAELARERSEGPSGPRGGELGTFGRGQMVAPFEEAAFSLEEGEISEVVQTQFGFHVIQVTEKIESGNVPVEQVTPNIRQYLGQQRQADALGHYVDELREEAEIEVTEPNRSGS